MFMMSSMMLPMYMLAMTPQTKSGFFWKSRGPGCRPNIIRAPSMIAVVPEPGMPSVSSGTMAPPVEALLADSGPATPSMAPLPNCSGCLEKRFSVA